MIGIPEKKLYKVLRNVGVKPRFLKKAETLDELYLDDFDFTLLLHYFETEFGVQLKNNDIEYLTTLPAFYEYIKRKTKSNSVF